MLGGRKESLQHISEYKHCLQFKLEKARQSDVVTHMQNLSSTKLVAPDLTMKFSGCCLWEKNIRSGMVMRRVRKMPWLWVLKRVTHCRSGDAGTLGYTVCCFYVLEDCAKLLVDSVAFSWEGEMPVVVKEGIITLYLRKSLLDPSQISSYNFSTHPFWLVFTKTAPMWPLQQCLELAGCFGSIQLFSLSSTCMALSNQDKDVLKSFQPKLKEQTGGKVNREQGEGREGRKWMKVRPTRLLEKLIQMTDASESSRITLICLKAFFFNAAQASV